VGADGAEDDSGSDDGDLGDAVNEGHGGETEAGGDAGGEGEVDDHGDDAVVCGDEHLIEKKSMASKARKAMAMPKDMTASISYGELLPTTCRTRLSSLSGGCILNLQRAILIPIIEPPKTNSRTGPVHIYYIMPGIGSQAGIMTNERVFALRSRRGRTLQLQVPRVSAELRPDVHNHYNRPGEPRKNCLF